MDINPEPTETYISTSTTATETDIATSTATSRVALTTPYDFPKSCQSNWKRTSVAWTKDGRSALSVLVLDPIPSCYPAGWSGSKFSFSPALCPTGWVYQDIAHDTISSELVSTAFCCQSGYKFNYYTGYKNLDSTPVSNPCGRWVKSTRESSQDDETTTAEDDIVTAPDGTLMIHQAWAITWASSDRTQLTPMPPTLTSGETWPSWEPHEPQTTPRPTQLSEDNLSYDPSVVWFLMVGLPIIVVALLVFCWLCGRRRQKKTRGQEAIEMNPLPPRVDAADASKLKTR